MGVGRRMKKQGPPAPLSEFHITSLKKRKAQDTEEGTRSKKRRSFGDQARYKSTSEAPNGIPKIALSQSKKDVVSHRRTKQVDQSSTRSPSSRSSRRPQPDAEGSNTDAADLLVDDGEGEGSLFGVLDAEEIDLGAGGLQDDFLESGSSVYDSDQGGGNAMFSEDEGGSDAEEMLTAANIEGLSRRLDAAQEDEAAEGQLELEESALQTNIDGDRVKVLQDAEEDEEGATAASRLAPNLQLLRARITDTVRVLDDFSRLSEEGRSRTDYTSQLLKDICTYYGYSSFLATKLLDLFPPREAFAFFEANESARPLTIRTNTLKTHRRELAQSLINRGVTLEPVGKWSKVGLQIFESQVPLGATPEYLAGHYMLQAASSFLPVMALAPQPHERILDMAAAPGGKTTYISALMKNTGCVFANDANKARAKALIGNIHRLGAKNTIVCSHDAREFPKVIGGFDRVLLDAPCSGTGVIAKDPSVKTNKTEKDFMLLPHLQKQLLLAAIDSVDHASKSGGYIVYSTCSVTVEENEQVVQYALRKRPNVRLVETGLTFGVEGFVNYMGKTFDRDMKMTRRYYPHKYNVDGFFVSKLKKVGPSPTSAGAALSTKAGMNGDATEGAGDEDLIEDLDPEGVNGFGGWEAEEDKVYMEKAKRRRLKRKGIDPKSKRGDGKTNGMSE